MTLRKKFKKWLYGNCPGFAGSFPYYGTKTYFPENSIIFQLACEQGIYESYNLHLISSLISPNSVYFDVGANIGLMSIPILSEHPTCIVVSMEASPKTLEFLMQTANESIFRDRWCIVGKAVGNRIGNMDFYMASVDKGAFDGIQDTKRGGETTQVNVPMTTIDMEWESMGKPIVSVIKLDVEGYEIEILKGALNCIQREHPCILLEWNTDNLQAYNIPVEVLLDFAIEFNYQLLAIHCLGNHSLHCLDGGALPHLFPVNNKKLLDVHMIKTESFLLLPDR